MKFVTPSPHSQCITFRAKAETLVGVIKESGEPGMSISKTINAKIHNALNILISSAKQDRKKENE